MKWSAIELTIAKLFNPKTFPKIKDRINAHLFERPCEASHKFDGTNVGKDQDGNLYGRNKMINMNAQSYQKTSLDALKPIDVAPVKKEIEGLIGVEDLGNFVLYGELMCNKGMYDYEDKGLAAGWTIFGAMIKPPKDAPQVVEALEKASFTCSLKGGAAEDEGEDQENPDYKIKLTINGTFKALMDKFGYPTVPYLGAFENLYTLMTQNQEWLIKGMGEGIVINHLATDKFDATGLSKWKNGLEENATNRPAIEFMMQQIEEDKENEIFGENTQKAIELMTILEQVDKSRLIMGAPPQPKKKENKAKAPKQQKQQRVLSEEQQALYDAAIKSAKTKFDHEDTYFEKGGKGNKEYAGLIAKECLNDITPDDEQEHLAIVSELLMPDFIAFQRAKGAAKKAAQGK